MALRKSQPDVDPVVREFAAIGKYRVRVVRTGIDTAVLDVREYAKGFSFEGFTRRGIRIASVEEALALRDAIDETIKQRLLRASDPDHKKCARCGRNNPAQTKDLCTVCEDEGDAFAPGHDTNCECPQCAEAR